MTSCLVRRSICTPVGGQYMLYGTLFQVIPNNIKPAEEDSRAAHEFWRFHGPWANAPIKALRARSTLLQLKTVPSVSSHLMNFDQPPRHRGQRMFVVMILRSGAGLKTLDQMLIQTPGDGQMRQHQAQPAQSHLLAPLTQRR